VGDNFYATVFSTFRLTVFPHLAYGEINGLCVRKRFIANKKRDKSEKRLKMKRMEKQKKCIETILTLK
jgi:predicted RNase H-like nuclease